MKRPTLRIFESGTFASRTTQACKRAARICTVIFVVSLTNSFGQSKASYDFAFNEISKMLKGQSPLDFKKAVFLSENAFHSNKLDYKEFCQKIDGIEVRLKQFMKDKGVADHVMGKQFAIFNYMMEPSKYNENSKLTYDFDDLMGNKDWTKMFVTKLLRTKTGNCHSLPYLYKILAEEVGAETYLALAPNHLYIKHKDDKGQWVNVELTNGTFPRDGWVMSSLSITTEAIKKETYMEALSLKESVALTLFDLAQGYKFQFGHDDFTLKCCNTVIEYFPKCVNAYMMKNELLTEKRKSLLLASNNKKTKEISQLEKSVTVLYQQIDNMGYKDMPKAQYEQWVKDVEDQKNKQQGKATAYDNSKNK